MQWVIRLSAVTLPLLLLAAGAAALYKKQDVFTVLTDGAREGLKTVGRLIPVLCGLLLSLIHISATITILTEAHGASSENKLNR